MNGIRRWFAELEDVWAELSIDVQGYHDAGDGRVLELARFKAIGKVSGVPVDQPQAILVEIRDGKMLAARGFVSHEEALEPPGCRSSKCSLHDQESRDSETSEPIRTQHDAATQRSSA